MILQLAVALAASQQASWDLESDDGGLVASGLAFEWGEVASGPKRGHTGANAWGTRLDGAYYPESTDRLTLPAAELAGFAAPVLELAHWLEIDASDCARLEAYSGNSWETIEPVYGYPDDGACLAGTDGDWEPLYVDLTGLDDLSDVRLVLETDDSVQLDGWYIDDLVLWEGDRAPPRVLELSELDTTDDVVGPYAVSAVVADDIGVTSVQLVYTVDAADELSVELADGGDGVWEGGLPGQDPDSSVAWWVVASDGENEARFPSLGEERRFRVRLPAPTDLAAPAERTVGDEVELDWTAPESRHALAGYVVYVDDEAVAEVDGAPALVPLDVSGTLEAEVAGLFDVPELGGVWEGDRSDPASFEAAVPTLHSLEPGQAWQGDIVRLSLVGSYVLFTAGSVEVDLGDGVTVVGVEVDSVDRAVVSLEIADDAPVSERDLLVRSGDVELELEAVFSVLDGADRPGVTSVQPSSIVQGESVTLSIELSQAPEGDVQVSLGDAIVVESASVDGHLVSATVAVGAQAALGERAVLVDDGTRTYSGVGLEVRDATTPPSTGCGSAGLGPWWLVLLALRRKDEVRS